MHTYKEKSFENIVRWSLRIFVVLVVAVYVIGLRFLPVESDEYFEENLSKKYDTDITEESVLYKGTFEHILDDGTTEPIELPCKINAAKGAKVSIKSTIPEDFNEDYIVVRASQQNLSIFIGGTLRVTYDTAESRPVGSQTTSRYVFCRTSAEDAGKELRISTVSDTLSYSGTINSVYACDRYNFWRYIFAKSSTSIILGIISMAIGIFIAIVGLSLSYVMHFRNGLEDAGWCILFAGTWLTCESQVRQLLTTNASSLSNICFAVILLCPIPYAMYMNELQGRRYRKIYKIIMLIAAADTVIQNVLLQLNISDFVDMLPVTHAILAASFVTGVVLMIRDINSGDIKEYHEVCFGLVLLMVCVLGEIAHVYYANMMYGLLLIVGVVVFTLSAMMQSIRQYREYERHKHEGKLREQKAHSDAITMQMIKTLSDTLESKESHTKGHSAKVSIYSAKIARKLGMSEEDIAKLEYAASLHDIGKMGIPDAILNKDFTDLTPSEYDIVKTHTIIGADLLKDIDLISYTQEVARYHHERYDGTGYPEGLAGEEIPIMARIVAVAEAYDAMNSRRVYRNRLSTEEIRAEINANRGTQFDPQVVDIFLELLDNNELQIPDSEKIIEDVSITDYANGNDAGQMFSAVVNTIKNKADGDNIDFLTGLMLRNKGEAMIAEAMQESAGVFIFFDMDNLKTVNDIFGHKMGDLALRTLGDLINESADKLVACRVGGDEFVSFYKGASRDDAKVLVEHIISEYAVKQQDLPTISRTTISAGLYVTSAGEEFEEAKNKADKALYYVKKNGKNNYSFYIDIVNSSVSEAGKIDLTNLITAIKTSGTYTGSLNIEYREFTKIYEYIVKMCRRYEHTCHLVLVTLETAPGSTINIEEFENAMECMGVVIKENMRNVDVCTRYSSAQYLVILLEAGDQNIDLVMQRVFEHFKEVCPDENCIPTYQASSMRNAEG